MHILKDITEWLRYGLAIIAKTRVMQENVVKPSACWLFLRKGRKWHKQEELRGPTCVSYYVEIEHHLLHWYKTDYTPIFNNTEDAVQSRPYLHGFSVSILNPKVLSGRKIPVIFWPLAVNEPLLPRTKAASTLLEKPRRHRQWKKSKRTLGKSPLQASVTLRRLTCLQLLIFKLETATSNFCHVLRGGEGVGPQWGKPCLSDRVLLVGRL